MTRRDIYKGVVETVLRGYEEIRKWTQPVRFDKGTLTWSFPFPNGTRITADGTLRRINCTEYKYLISLIPCQQRLVC